MDRSEFIRTTAAYNPGPGGVRTAFVLAAPGQVERDAGRPAAGDTGANLDRILVHLRRHDPAAFPTTCRYDYRIANSVETVLFGNKSMPAPADVSDPANLDRLAEQLAGIETIIALSAPALSAVLNAGFQAAYSHRVHPGMRGLNSRFPGLGDNVKEKQWRVEERCRRYAEELVQSSRRPR